MYKVDYRRSFIGKFSSRGNNCQQHRYPHRNPTIFVCEIPYPVKSLIRLKSVSKHWFSLITSSQFSTTHKPVTLTITHSCNGLLLVQYHSVTFTNYTKHYMVGNLTIRKYAHVEKPTVFSSEPKSLPRRIGSYLAFDPLKSPHYKVAFMGVFPGLNVQIDIYCSESASWKQIVAPSTRLEYAAFCGGVIHWLSDENIVLGFDVYSEKMINMPNAPKIHDVSTIIHFGECDGRLIVILASDSFEMEFKILEMDKDYGSWTAEGDVDRRHLISALHQTTPYWSGKFSMVSVFKEQEEKGYALILGLPGKAISYNLRLKTWKVHFDAVPVGLICNGDPFVTAHPYIESLSPV